MRAEKKETREILNAVMTLEMLRSDCEKQANFNKSIKRINVQALLMAIKALKKQAPERVKEIYENEYFCPVCRGGNRCSAGHVEDQYCPKCGHKLWIEM